MTLPQAGLTGTLPSILSQLTSLVCTNFAGNTLRGSMPLQWSTLTRLQSLDLRNNRLTGQLPAQWSSLRALTRTGGTGRRLLVASETPAGLYPEVPNPDVSRIVFDGNSIQGTLPAAWSVLTNLNRVSGSRNRLTGTLPGQWSTLTSLTILDVSNNGFTGSIPAAWSTLSKLELFLVQVGGALWGAVYSPITTSL